MIDKNSGNVLFIVSDQLRADCLQLAINGRVVLPNLREFMEDAVTFRRHYTVTCPCGPA
ncbi:MAG: sulfatase-like hydrolase/transferase, partial [Rhodobacteraceae bacterium]|nr:sulfatase-like hydrolase/transferase [Paracoccaceae bacterium]